jgi:Fe-S cluster biosynthesis and repair protein YggX
MALMCVRCGHEGEPPQARRVGFTGAVKEQILKEICESCWKEWEGVEVKVINEYRLNFMDPQHREMLARACRDFLAQPRNPA